MSIKRTEGPLAFLEALQHVVGMMERGDIASLSAMYDPTGLGRISVTTVDGVEVDLPEFDNSEAEALEERSRRDTAPGKKLRK